MSSLRGRPLLRATTTRTSPFSGSRYLRPSGIPTRSSPVLFRHIRHGRRSFHWQPAASSAIEGAQTLIVDLHTATNLPWFLTIPLVAFTVGTIFRLPFLVYTQQILRRRAEFSPVLQAWNWRVEKEVEQEGIPASWRLSEVKRRQERTLKRVYRKLGLQEWRLYGSLLSFPFWLIAIDGVRRLCGGPRGLIGSLITDSLESGEMADTGATPTSLPLHTVVTPPTIDVDPAVVSSAVDTARGAVVDPSLTLEGCLWFTDLTASDPYHILPLVLSATLVWNLVPLKKGDFSDRVQIALGRRPKGTRAQILTEDEKVSLGERAKSTFYLSMVGIATLVGPLTMDLPAALHLYWLASSMTNAGFAKGLRHLMPVRKNLRMQCTGVELPVIRPQRGQKGQ